MLSLVANLAQAADEDAFLKQVQPPVEQTVGYGRSAMWTLPLVATQYQPEHPTPSMQAAMQAQREGRFLDAMIQLDEASKTIQPGSNAEAELKLLRASFMLQGNQAQQALASLASVTNTPTYSADAYALVAMSYLEQGQAQGALTAAQHAQQLGQGLLPTLALSYALQNSGQLAEAHDVMHRFNAGVPSSAIALAREAELALTLDQTQAARALAERARATDDTQPYVIAVSGLVYLIDDHALQAKSAFENALQRDPNDPKALLGLGLAEIRLGNFKAGMEKLQAANEADPNNALILTYLGRAQQQLGQTDAAQASWRAAQQADPKDPIPWLYQAQAELQANRPLDARESLRQAQARLAYRSVYRGERLLKQDEQLLQANLAAAQNQMGLEDMALQSLSDTVGTKSSASLRAEADVLQGQRFGESARRSLLLQSLFNDRPGNLPSELDVYGDGAGVTGAQAPQHGTVSGLNAQQLSYNNYDTLFVQPTTAAMDGIKGNQNTSGGQARVGMGSDTLGLSLALRDYKTDGTGTIPNLLNNRIGQGVLQWRPSNDTQTFVSYQAFHSLHGETQYPADPINFGAYHLIQDNSSIVRVGVRQDLSDRSELLGLVSRQRTDQTDNSEFISFMPPYSTSNLPGLGPTLPFPQATQFASSNAHSEELQYRTSDADSATQWGAHLYRGPYIYHNLDLTSTTRQVYAARQQMLGAHWQVDAHLAWEIMDVQDNANGGNRLIYLQRWLPQLGVVYTPDRVTHVRVAAWHEIAGDTVGDATLDPATVAGIVTKRPGERNNLIQSVALVADRQLNPAWLLEGKAQQRYADLYIQPSSFIRKQTDESRLALHWHPDGHPLMVTLAYDYERVQAPPGPIAAFAPAPDSVDSQRLRSHQVEVRWFATEQWTATLNWSRNLVAGTLQSSDLNFNPILVPFHESFDQTDAKLAWRFNKAGAMSVGVRNAGNKHFQYTNLDPLNPRFSAARFAYARLSLAW